MIEKPYAAGKTIIILGSHQIEKATLLKKKGNFLFLNAYKTQLLTLLENANETRFRQIIR